MNERDAYTNIQFHGPLYTVGAIIAVDGIAYMVTAAAVERLKSESNARAYVEAIEYLAYCERTEIKANHSIYFVACNEHGKIEKML